jgi:ADP-L-glycero-D-manno-heptose 6-epimerase
MIIVTGAGGFIGSNIVKALNAQGITDILVVDNVIDNLEGAQYAEHYDIPRFYSKFKRWADVEIIFHEGAVSSTTETDTQLFSSMNIGPSKYLLEKNKEHKFLLSLASSAGVYGRSTTFNEDEEMDPLSVYAYSKAVVDEMIEDGANVQSWRYFNVYGSPETHKKTQASPVSKFLLQANVAKEIEVFENSDQYKRDFVCVDDIVAIKLMAAKTTFRGICNIGTGNPISFQEVAEIVSEKTGASIKTVPFPPLLKEQYQEYTCADLTKLKSIIGDYKFKTVRDYVSSQ